MSLFLLKVKNCTNHFTRTAEDPRVRYLGNVALGQNVTLANLRENYHAVLLTYGAEQVRRSIISQLI